MSENRLTLIEPTESLQDAYLDFLADFRAAGEKDIHGAGGIMTGDFAEFVQLLENQAQGIDLTDGRVPAGTYWLVLDDKEVVGTVNLRHRLTPFLEHEGGHIGYSVRPSQRRKGYASTMLAMMLDKARQLGLPCVLITCDKDNVASAGVIRRNGGVLENEVFSERDGKLMQRYWIDL